MNPKMYCIFSTSSESAPLTPHPSQKGGLYKDRERANRAAYDLWKAEGPAGAETLALICVGAVDPEGYASTLAIPFAAADTEGCFDSRVRYLAISAGNDGYVDVCASPAAANDAALELWEAIPPKMRNDIDVYARKVTREHLFEWALDDLDAGDERAWSCFGDADDFPGAFDSSDGSALYRAARSYARAHREILLDKEPCWSEENGWSVFADHAETQERLEIIAVNDILQVIPAR